MKTNKVLLFCFALVVSTLSATAQTADNIAAKATWKLNLGTADQVATFTPEGSSDFILRNYMTVGSELTVSGIANTSDGHTQTFFKQGSKKSSMSDNNAVCFMLEPKPGIAFTPSHVSFKAARWVTDDCKMDAYWVNDDNSRKTLMTSQKPNRDGSDATVSTYSFDLTGTKASEGVCGLRINIYGMNSGKQVSLGDIEIEGTLYGTVGEVITYSLTIDVSPAGAGIVEVSPNGTSFPTGEKITLTQTPNEGYIFTGWQNEAGTTVSTASPYVFNLEGNTHLTAKYSSKEEFLKGDYTVIPSGDVNAFRAALKAANENTTGARQYIRRCHHPDKARTGKRQSYLTDSHQGYGDISARPYPPQ